MSEDWGLVTLPTSGDPEKIAIGRLKAASDMALKYYGTPLVVTTSGGKDSSVCVELAPLWTGQTIKYGAFCRMQRCLSIRCMNVSSAALAVSAARWRARNGMRSSDAGLLTRSSTYKPLTGCLMSAERAERWTEAG